MAHDRTAGFLFVKIMIPLETTSCGMSMYWKVKRVADGIRDLPMTYGNALTNIMITKVITRKSVGRTKLFIMRHVSQKKTQGAEKHILNQGRANVI